MPSRERPGECTSATLEPNWASETASRVRAAVNERRGRRSALVPSDSWPWLPAARAATKRRLCSSPRCEMRWRSAPQFRLRSAALRCTAESLINRRDPNRAGAAALLTDDRPIALAILRARLAPASLCVSESVGGKLGLRRPLRASGVSLLPRVAQAPIGLVYTRLPPPQVPARRQLLVCVWRICAAQIHRHPAARAPARLATQPGIIAASPCPDSQAILGDTLVQSIGSWSCMESGRGGRTER